MLDVPPDDVKLPPEIAAQDPTVVTGFVLTPSGGNTILVLKDRSSP